MDHDALDEAVDLTPSRNIKGINQRSAKVVILKAFKVNSLQNLTVKDNLQLLGKKLKIKTRSLSKYAMLVPLAKGLISQNYVKPKDHTTVDYLNLSRDDLSLLKCIPVGTKNENNRDGDDILSSQSTSNDDRSSLSPKNENDGGGDTDILSSQSNGNDDCSSLSPPESD